MSSQWLTPISQREELRERFATVREFLFGKSAGQAAYERDLAKQPTYHDGTRRPSWNQLDELTQWSWQRNPTDR